MVTAREAFKVGFLRHCANQGLTADEAGKLASFAKQAILRADSVDKESGLLDFLTKPYNTAYDVLGSVLKQVGSVGVAGGLAVPPLIGLGLGYSAAKSQDIDEDDVAAVKKRELIDEYRRNAEMLRRKEKKRR